MIMVKMMVVGNYKNKQEAQKLFLDFWEIPQA